MEPSFYGSQEKYQVALTPEEAKKLNDIHGALFGLDGNPGLLKDFKELAQSHYRLRNRYWMLVAFLAGSGFLGLGAFINGIIP